jgi:hypothetical protein
MDLTKVRFEEVDVKQSIINIKKRAHPSNMIKKCIESNDSESVSSETAEKRNKWKRNKNKLDKNVKAPKTEAINAMIPEPQPNATFATVADDGIPNVLPFDELYKQFDHIKEADWKQDPVDKQRLKEDSARFHKQMDEEKLTPVLKKEMDALINDLPRPIFRVSLDTSSDKRIDYVQQLKERTHFLPVFTAAYMREMSQEAGKFIHSSTGTLYDFPPCCKGDKCCLRKLPIKGMPKGGITGMMFFFPDEYKQFLKTRVAPMVERPCVTCVCYTTMSLYIMLSAYPERMTVDQDCVFQSFRNISDDDGGYRHEFLIGPKHNKYVGIVDMIRMIRCRYLTVIRYNKTHRYGIDDSPMAWKPPQRITPLVGETRADFLHRSRDYYRGMERTELHLDTRPTLLRLSQGRNPDLEVAYFKEYKAHKTYDSAINADSFIASNEAYRVSKFQRIVCEDTIADMYHKLLDCCFFSQIKGPAKKDPYVYIVGKTLPHKCGRRKFPYVAARCIQENPRFRDDILDWFVCSILGNYRHVQPEFRPPLSVRARVYDVRYSNPYKLISLFYQESDDKKKITCQHENLLKCAVGEYLVFMVNDNPVLKEHINNLFDWDYYSTTIVNTMNQIRLLMWTDSPNPGIEPANHAQLEQICAASQALILKGAYKKNQPSLCMMFHNMRSFLSKKHGFEMKKLDEEHKQAIRTLVFRSDPVYCNPTKTIVEALPLLGCSKEASKEMYRLHEMHDEFKLRDEPVHRKLLEIATSFPYTLSLFNYFSDQWKASNWIHIRRLPYHYTFYQLQAISERFKTKENVVPAELVEFWFCPVCRKEYSILTTEPRTCPKSKTNPNHPKKWCVHHKQYEFGYDKIVADYTTNRYYCLSKKRDKEKVRHELVNVSLLGNLLVMKNTQITLCPQQACGRPMVINPQFCEYNERGFACAFCSQRIRQEHKKRMQSITDISVNLDLPSKCSICWKPVSKNAVLHLYPHNVVMCHKHPNRECIDAVEALIHSPKYRDDEKQVIETINKSIRVTKEFNREKFANKLKSDLNRARRASRQRK